MSNLPASLGPYPIEREIGRGGMGVVYLGRDPKLNRPVAIKVLPETLASAESIARFDREARLLASLNHPNIATIYGVEEASGQRFLVLEYIPGDTLAEQLRARAHPGSKDPGLHRDSGLHLDESLDACRQIALAIEAAHEGGVIHRDLKPGNVKITPDGQVKVLDFGLAKGVAVSDAELAHSPTMTFAATGMGVILGTAGYMSPEQARGKAVDRRTDVWSFGCVLFECLAGKQTFEGETVSDTIANILQRDPDWNALPANTPPRVREILRRCLEKDLKKRQRDIGDVRIQLEEAIAERATSTRTTAAMSHTTPATAPASSRIKTLGFAAALVLVGAAAGIGLGNAFGLLGGGSSGGAAGLLRTSIAIPRSIRAYDVSLTPDGQTFIVRGAVRKPDGTDDPIVRLYARRVDDYELRPIAGTDRVQGYPGYSSDSKWIAILRVVSDQSTQKQIVKLPLDGSSPPLKLATVADNWESFAWLDSGDMLIALSGGKKFVRLPKGSETPGPEISFDFPDESASGSFRRTLPNDRGVFMSVGTYGPRGWWGEVWVLDLKTNKTHRLLENAGIMAYSPTGHLVVSRNDTLMAAPFDLADLKVTGDVTTLSGDLRIEAAWEYGEFALSTNGTLLFRPGGLVGADRQLVYIDATGTAIPFGAERRAYEQYPAVSPDGRRVAVVLPNEKGNYEIWTADRSNPVIRRTIAMPNVDCALPHWSPDGRRLEFMRTATDKDDGVYVQNADGTGAPQLVIRKDNPAANLAANSWTKDSAGLILTKSNGSRNSLHYVSVPAAGGAATSRALRTTTSSDSNGQVSPDGKFLAFVSDESGKFETYVAVWSGDALQGQPLMVSSAGGAGGGLGWADDNRLFYNTPQGKLMSAAVGAKPALSVSKPVVVHDLQKLRVRGWNILPDGRLFAIQKSDAEDDITAVSVVFNWFEELRQRMSKH